jgi:hypothetical protein
VFTAEEMRDAVSSTGLYLVCKSIDGVLASGEVIGKRAMLKLKRSYYHISPTSDSALPKLFCPQFALTKRPVSIYLSWTVIMEVL